MTDLYTAVAATPDGNRRLAAAHARYDTLRLLHRTLEGAKLTRSALANRLGIRKSAVSQVLSGNGNVRINTLADYLYECGQRLVLSSEQLSDDPRGASPNKASIPAPLHTRTCVSLVWADEVG